jgi:hypothetical protein
MPINQASAPRATKFPGYPGVKDEQNSATKDSDFSGRPRPAAHGGGIGVGGGGRRHHRHGRRRRRRRRRRHHRRHRHHRHHRRHHRGVAPLRRTGASFALHPARTAHSLRQGRARAARATSSHVVCELWLRSAAGGAAMRVRAGGGRPQGRA